MPGTGYQIAKPQRIIKTAAQITRELCLKYGITLEELRAEDRFTYTNQARQELMWLLRQPKSGDRSRYSFIWIGLYLERDPSTVVHGVNAHMRRNSYLLMGPTDPLGYWPCITTPPIRPDFGDRP